MSVKTEECNTISNIYVQGDNSDNLGIQFGYEGSPQYLLIFERYKEKTWEEGFNPGKYIEEHQEEVEAVLNTGNAYSEENFVIRRMETIAAAHGIVGFVKGKRPYICEIFAVKKKQDNFIVNTQSDGNNRVTVRATFTCEDCLMEEEIKKGVFIFSKSEYKTSKRITLSRQNTDDGYKSGAIEYSADGGHTWIPLTEKCIGRQLIINTSKKVRFHVYEKYKNLFDIKEV